MIKTIKIYKKTNFTLLTLGTKGQTINNIFIKSFESMPTYPFSLNFKRSHHNSKFHFHLKALYSVHKGRRTTITPFEEKPLKTCPDLLSKVECNKFFKEFHGKGGIYKFTLKNKPNVFYIGSTRNLPKRFYQHTFKDA